MNKLSTLYDRIEGLVMQKNRGDSFLKNKCENN